MKPCLREAVPALCHGGEKGERSLGSCVFPMGCSWMYFMPTTSSRPALADPIRILPLGDSITAGLNRAGDEPGGYRTRLYERLSRELFHAVRGYRGVEYVGLIRGPEHGRSWNPDPRRLPAGDHEGHSGFRIDQIEAAAEVAVPSTSPAVVLLHAGTNDILQDDRVSSAPNRLRKLLNRIHRLQPETHILLARIIGNRNTNIEARIRTFNREVDRLAAQLRAAGRSVYSVDMFRIVNAETGTLADPSHPNAKGYDAMADAWFEAIQLLEDGTNGKLMNPPRAEVTAWAGGPCESAAPSRTDAGSTISPPQSGEQPS